MTKSNFKLKPAQPLERVEQEALFQWAQYMERTDPRLRLLNSSLNGVRLTPNQALMAKRGGMKKGFPDVFLPVPAGGWHGLFIEMKRKGGVPSDVSPEQCKWINNLRYQGYHAVVCYGWESAAQIISGYLGLVRT